MSMLKVAVWFADNVQSYAKHDITNYVNLQDTTM